MKAPDRLPFFRSTPSPHPFGKPNPQVNDSVECVKRDTENSSVYEILNEYGNNKKRKSTWRLWQNAKKTVKQYQEDYSIEIVVVYYFQKP